MYYCGVVADLCDSCVCNRSVETGLSYFCVQYCGTGLVGDGFLC